MDSCDFPDGPSGLPEEGLSEEGLPEESWAVPDEPPEEPEPSLFTA
ncbi:hypothetical protein IL992_16445 [Microbispora sp. NEAU-D428]|nr:hypothetical protein [Microbispora sitophila]MBE3010774.1 hypothetical protein [Microbispora sitophila]